MMTNALKENLLLLLTLFLFLSVNSQIVVMTAVDLNEGEEEDYIKLESFYSEIHKEAKISKTADIGPYVVIGPKVEIGENVKIHSHVNISGNTVIGKDNKICFIFLLLRGHATSACKATRVANCIKSKFGYRR